MKKEWRNSFGGKESVRGGGTRHRFRGAWEETQIPIRFRPRPGRGSGYVPFTRIDFNFIKPRTAPGIHHGLPVGESLRCRRRDGLGRFHSKYDLHITPERHETAGHFHSAEQQSSARDADYYPWLPHPGLWLTAQHANSRFWFHCRGFHC